MLSLIKHAKLHRSSILPMGFPPSAKLCRLVLPSSSFPMNCAGMSVDKLRDNLEIHDSVQMFYRMYSIGGKVKAHEPDAPFEPDGQTQASPQQVQLLDHFGVILPILPLDHGVGDRSLVPSRRFRLRWCRHFAPALCPSTVFGWRGSHIYFHPPNILRPTQ